MNDQEASIAPLQPNQKPRGFRWRSAWIAVFVAAAVLLAVIADLWIDLGSKAIVLAATPGLVATDISVSPDGREIAVSVSEEQYDLEKRPSQGVPQLRFADLATRRESKAAITGKRCILPRYAPEGNLFAAYEFHGIQFFDPASKESLFRFDSALGLHISRRMEFSKDGKWIAAIRELHHVSVWNIQDRALTDTITFRNVSALQFSNDNQLLLFSNRGTPEWQIWGTRGGHWSNASPLISLEGLYGDLSMSLDGALFAILRRSGWLEIWNVHDRRKIIEHEACRFTENPFMGVRICFLADSRTLITSGEVDSSRCSLSRDFPYWQRKYRCITQIKAWDVKTLQCIQTFHHASDVRSIVAIPGSSEFATLDADSNVIAWKVRR